MIRQPSRATTSSALPYRGCSVGSAAAAAVVAFLAVGSSGVTPGVENAAAAIRKAVTLTAASAEQSGTAEVRISHDGQLWAGKVISWNGNDVELNDTTRWPQSGYPLLVVDGMMYGHGPESDGWIELGPTSSIDPGSGTTPPNSWTPSARMSAERRCDG